MLQNTRVAFFCRCGCGTQTAYNRPEPGSVLHAARLFGLVAGHKLPPIQLIKPDFIAQRRRASLLVNAAEALGLVRRRFA